MEQTSRHNNVSELSTPIQKSTEREVESALTRPVQTPQIQVIWLKPDLESSTRPDSMLVFVNNSWQIFSEIYVGGKQQLSSQKQKGSYSENNNDSQISFLLPFII